MVLKNKKIIFMIIPICFIGILLLFPKKTVTKEITKVILKPEHAQCDLYHDYEILKERVDLSFNQANLIQEEDGFVLEIASNEVNKANLAEFIEFYICETNKVYLASFLSQQYYSVYGYITGLEKSDITSYSIVDTDDKKREIHMYLSDRVNKMVEQLDVDTIAIVRDNSSSDYTSNGIMEEGFTLNKVKNEYVLSFSKNNLLYGKEESFMYSLMDDKLSTSYNYFIQNEIDWENTKKTLSSELGINQVSKLSEEGVYTFTFAHEDGRSTVDEMAELSDRVKGRLDCLKSPYVYGVNKNEDLSIQISKDRIGNFILSSLERSDSFSLRCGYRSVSIPQDILEIDEENNDIDLYVTKGILEKLDTIVSKSSDNRVYLALNEYPIAYLDYQQDVTDSKLHFSTFCYKEDNNVDSWFINYLDQVYNSENNINIAYHLSNIKYEENGYGDKSHYGLQDSYLFDLEDLTQELMNTYDGIDVSSSKAYVFVNFEDMSAKEIVDRMASVIQFIQDKNIFINGIQFGYSSYEGILFMCDGEVPSFYCSLLDVNKKEFNKELIEEMKKNEMIHSMLFEEYEAALHLSDFDSFFDELWNVVLPEE